MSMIKEFKAFAMRGNVMDMAVGVVIGGAFGKIVTSLVGDLIMPLVGQVTGKVDFSNLFINLSGQSYDSLKAARDAGAAVVAYGTFINVVIDFIIVAFAIFLVMKGMNAMRKKEAAKPAAPAAPPPPSGEEKLLAEILGVLKSR